MCGIVLCWLSYGLLCICVVVVVSADWSANNYIRWCWAACIRCYAYIHSQIENVALAVVFISLSLVFQSTIKRNEKLFLLKSTLDSQHTNTHTLSLTLTLTGPSEREKNVRKIIVRRKHKTRKLLLKTEPIKRQRAKRFVVADVVWWLYCCWCVWCVCWLSIYQFIQIKKRRNSCLLEISMASQIKQNDNICECYTSIFIICIYYVCIVLYCVWYKCIYWNCCVFTWRTRAKTHTKQTEDNIELKQSEYEYSKPPDKDNASEHQQTQIRTKYV